MLGAGPIRRLLVTFLATGAAAFPATANADLAASLARQMRAAGPTSGAYVLDAASGKTLFSWNAATPRILASDTKLFTTAAALDRFGAEGTLTTQVLASSAIDPDGVLKGDLWLKGAGDPAFGTRWYVRRYYGPSAASVQDLAVQLADSGLRAVRGGVHGDESLFDQIRGVHDSAYGVSGWIGPLSALAFNHGYDKRGFQRSPASYAASQLRAALDSEGIAPGHAAAPSPAPASAVVLAKVSSPPMSWLVRLTNKDSDNFFAETLLKTLGSTDGGVGTTSAGARVVRAYAARSGAQVQLIDGSGLDRGDRASPEAVVQVLDAVRRAPIFQAFYDSLPVAGVDGTLDHRLRKGPARRNCRAKTGSLVGVSTLSGFCTARSGQPLVFSLLMNGISVSFARRLQDRIATAIAGFSG